MTIPIALRRDFSAVCTENSIRIDLVTESLNVSDDDCTVMLFPGAVHIGVQIKDPT